MEPKDLTEALAKVAVDQATARFDSAMNSLASQGQAALRIPQRKLKKALQVWISKSYRRYHLGKCLTSPRTPRPVAELFVPPSLRHDSVRYDNTNWESLISIGDRLVITATAGAGKSTLAKQLFIEELTAGDKLPVFIELRALNEGQVSLVEHIALLLAFIGEEFDASSIRVFLADAQVSLILDGLDEVLPDRIDSVLKEIAQLSLHMQNAAILVTSRPYDKTRSIPEFAELELMPMRLGQALELLDRLDFEPEIVGRFKKALKTGLFEQRKDFASNPLLLQLMLMMYADAAQVPDRQNVFFERALEVLMGTHDAMKHGFKREYACKLDADSIKKIVAFQSLFSYFHGLTRFDEVNLKKYLRQGAQQLGIPVDDKHLLEDLTVRTCLFLKDGTEFTYTHRSFQEFFAAYAISLVPAQDRVAKVLAKATDRMTRDSVVDLLYGISPLLVEEALLLPALSVLHDRCKGKRDKYKEFLKFTGLRVAKLGRTRGIQFSAHGAKTPIGHVNVLGLYSFVDRHYKDNSSEVVSDERARKSYKAMSTEILSKMKESEKTNLSVEDVYSLPQFKLWAQDVRIISPSLFEHLLSVRARIVERLAKVNESIDSILSDTRKTSEPT